MADPIYELLESPVYNTAIRAVQDSDPALASAIFTPLFTAMLNNTHFVKLLTEQVAAQLSGHVQDKQNPHGGTAEQVGADPAGSAAGVQNSLNAFAARRDNPHGVTAAQVGAAAMEHTHTAAQVGAIPASDVIHGIREIWGSDTTPVRLCADEELNINIHGTDVIQATMDTGTGKSKVMFGATKVTGITTPIDTTDAANKDYVDTGLAGKAAAGHTHTAAQVGALPLSGGRMTGDLDMGTHNLTDVGRIRFRDTSTACLDFGVDMAMMDKQGRLYFALDYNIAAHQDMHMTSHRIRGVASPVEAGDATNKKYVDEAVFFMAVSEDGEPNREFFIDITKPGYVPIQLICADPAIVTNIRIVYSGRNVYAEGHCGDGCLRGYVVYIRTNFRLE